MNYFLNILILSILIGCNHKLFKRNSIAKTAMPDIQLDSTYLFKAKPQQGFNFDYYLYIPKGFDLDEENTLLVESTNTGLSDAIEHHRKGAKFAASKSSVGNHVSNKLGIPLLVPVFPRSQTNWKMYTHAFDSETFNEKGTQLERLDLQLLAMVEDAKKYFEHHKLKMRDRFFLTGFSASGTFANRFSILHPDKIKAVCAGGVNSILILPMKESNGKSLDFPIGIGDVMSVTGQEVDLKNFRELPQFWYMGENDRNDAAQFDDGYNPSERKLIFDILGESMMPERWGKVQMIYREKNIPAIFKTYKGMGHGTSLKMNDEIADFFEENLN